MYIMRALGKGKFYKQHGHLWIEAYFDISYSRDKGDQKSTRTNGTYIGGKLVSWISD